MAFKSKADQVAYAKKWRKAHREHSREQTRLWRLHNPDGYTKWVKANPEKVRERMDRFRKANPGYTTRWFKARRANDPNYRLQNSVRSRIWQALKGGRSKTDKFVALLGCTVREAVAHIERQFTGDMSWETYGRYGWHIDHIKPMSSFDLTNTHELATACHYTNLQPLWWNDNLAKGAKV